MIHLSNLNSKHDFSRATVKNRLKRTESLEEWDESSSNKENSDPISYEG